MNRNSECKELKEAAEVAEAYQFGGFAYKEKVSRGRNPYDLYWEKRKHMAWNAGFLSAEDEYLNRLNED